MTLLRNTPLGRPGVALVALAMTALAWPAAAQDAHQWTIQYGPRAGLLSGAVVGSAADISASYYNPGALALAEELPFALSTQVFQAAKLRVENGAGAGLDLDTNSSGVLPSLLGGRIKAGFLGKNVLTWSVLTRQRGGGEVLLSAALDRDSLPEDSEFDGLLGVFRLDQEFTEHWGGLSLARPLGEKFGLGASAYLSYRTHRRLGESVAQGVLGGALAASEIDVAGFEYSSIRAIFKLGAYADLGNLTLGATVTPPSLRVGGSGRTGLLFSSLDTDQDGSNRAAAANQPDLRADYRSPLSVGFGGSVAMGKLRLHASGEWFDSQPLYSVLQPDPFEAQVGGELVEYDTTHAFDDIFNYAVGLEWAVKGSIRGYASFNTDRSALVPGAAATIPFSAYDIYFANLGADFEVGKSDEKRRVTLGIGFGWGDRDADRLADLVDEGTAHLQYRAFRVLFGFSN